MNVAMFMMPATAGGYLDAVRQIVDQTLQGLPFAAIERARKMFAKGETAYAAGDYRTAYGWYSSAYQLAIR